MLDRVGDVHLGTIDPGLLQSRVQQPTGRANKGVPLAVFLVAGLLPDQHHLGGSRPLPKNRLGRVHPQVATPAARRRLPEP